RIDSASGHRIHSYDATEGYAITLASGRRVVATPEHTHFAGFKVGRTPQAYMTYLMWKEGVGFRVGTSRTYTHRRGQTVPGPAQRMGAEHADAAWVIGLHDTEAEARVAELVLSLRYRVPTTPFVAGHSARDRDGSLVGEQRHIDDVFGRLDTELGGRTLLADEGLSFAYPHFVAPFTTPGKRTRRR